MRKLTRREAVILCIALVVVPAIAFYRFRYEPHRRAAKKLIGKAADRRRLAQDPGRLAVLSRMRVERRQAVRRLRARVMHLERRFAPKANHVLQQLVVDISGLASRCGVTIEESVFPCKDTVGTLASAATDGPRYRRVGRDLPKASFLARYPEGSVYERPLLKLRVQTSFAGLRKFFAGLRGLRWRVTPIQFDIRRKALVPGGESGSVASLLEATVILAL